MDTAELRELLTPESLELLDALDVDALGDAVAAVSRLRAAGHSPARVAAVLSQARLRRRARAKFGAFADRMLFTEAGLEQSTRLAVASLHAGRFAAAGLDHVADLGCGIGADALALAGLDLGVLAVERDETTAALAAYNLAPFPRARVDCADATTVDLGEVDAAWLDPARRRAGASGAGGPGGAGGPRGRRLDDPHDWEPSLEFCFDLGRRIPVGVKLGPGLDRALLPADMEAQWVSVDREVVELVVWSGPLARAGVGRAALVLGAHGAAELTAAADSDDAEVGELGAWLYEPDGAVIRARLIGDLARRLDGRMIDETIAWITAETAVETPFAQRFRVLEELPFDEKRLKRLLRERGVGTLEIKKRGVDVDPAQLRKRLNPSGPASATLVLTRRGGRRVAILAERA
ncbi:class I SAM-dependent methyltransferase [Schumannella sp. 10F1B-5-1]|uniref:THUMP-like domain-containing protein n=1 Tax=Schumannella sp. 10F1B-5-1 TaxID=2590780 RepID=UPI001130FC6A|nr:class I SAM-dependent methyltransferase [Schumannella sp. 10F1B-5-1]TPW71776.1 SAM-dependent methyltransferase [Schumannella sp. 10F1B-5-1]